MPLHTKPGQYRTISISVDVRANMYHCWVLCGSFAHSGGGSSSQRIISWIGIGALLLQHSHPFIHHHCSVLNLFALTVYLKDKYVWLVCIMNEKAGHYQIWLCGQGRRLWQGQRRKIKFLWKQTSTIEPTIQPTMEAVQANESNIVQSSNIQHFLEGVQKYKLKHFMNIAMEQSIYIPANISQGTTANKHFTYQSTRVQNISEYYNRKYPRCQSTSSMGEKISRTSSLVVVISPIGPCSDPRDELTMTAHCALSDMMVMMTAMIIIMRMGILNQPFRCDVPQDNLMSIQKAWFPYDGCGILPCKNRYSPSVGAREENPEDQKRSNPHVSS